MGIDFDKIREFGNFRLDLQKSVLWHGNEPVSLQLKEIELLKVLTERAGDVITKNELLGRVWADSFVEDSNLTRHIYRIRRVFRELGEPVDLIQTVPRRGYRFTGRVRVDDDGLLVVERRSVSRTLVEELENSAAPDLQIPASASLRRSFAVYVAAALLAIVVLAASFGYFLDTRGVAGGKQFGSIAVLPLKSLAGGEDDKALNLGLADALITNLGQLNEVRVLSTNVISKYTDQDQDPVAIGRELSVDAVMEGTLQRANGQIRVTLRLIRTSDAGQIWSKSFDRAESEIFHLQDEIAVKTAGFLEANLNLEKREAALKHYTENTQAYRAYMTGRYLHFQANYEAAIEEFERALKFDSKYALALSGLADSYALLANRSAKEARVDYYEKAKSYALQALLLDDQLAEAHAALGWIRRIYDWDWAESEKHLRRAIELDPNFATAYQRLASLYITLGRTDEALRYSERASLLNPVNFSTGWALYCNREYEASATEYLRLASMPGSPEIQNDARVGAAMAYIEVGKYAEAISLLEQVPPEFHDSFKVSVTLAIAFFRSGHESRASGLLKKLEEISKTGPGYAVRLAYVYSVAGDRPAAIRQLRKGFAESDDRLMWLRSTPYFDAIRDDPGFQELLRAMKLNP
jgi:DNA-binding winged helix-turn-helix (wHTH) protein/TolB-like protein/thioredoxin-like negative regulator of GroEL